MRLPLGEFQCGECQTKFKAPLISDFAYGEYLLWSDTGGVAYLNAGDDPTFAEVRQLFRGCTRNEAPNHAAAGARLHDFFARVACDPDEEGGLFRIGGKPRCPNCQSNHMASWSLGEAAEMAEVETVELTHRIWNMLPDAEKLASVHAWIERHAGGPTPFM